MDLPEVCCDKDLICEKDRGETIDCEDCCNDDGICDAHEDQDECPDCNHCINGIKDADETDVDCGGVDCPPCGESSGGGGGGCSSARIDDANDELYPESMMRTVEEGGHWIFGTICKEGLFFSNLVVPLYLMDKEEFYDLFVEEETPVKSGIKAILSGEEAFINEAFLGLENISYIPPAKPVEMTFGALGKLQPRHIETSKTFLTSLFVEAESRRIKNLALKLLCSADQWQGLSLKEAFLLLDDMPTQPHCVRAEDDMLTYCAMLEGLTSIEMTVSEEELGQVIVERPGYLGPCVCSGASKMDKGR